MAVLAVVVAVFTALSAAPLFAQRFSCREVRKDKGIHVFNNATNADAFERSGEMGIGITKPGAGTTGRLHEVSWRRERNRVIGRPEAGCPECRTARTQLTRVVFRYPR